MFIVSSYSLAIVLCVVTMLCWGSWGNTQKLAGKTWRYELFYWDYVIGILLFSLIIGLPFNHRKPVLQTDQIAQFLQREPGPPEVFELSGAIDTG